MARKKNKLRRLEVCGNSAAGKIPVPAGTEKKFLGVGFKNRNCVLNVIGPDGSIEFREQLNSVIFPGFKGTTNDVKEIVAKIKAATEIKEFKFFHIGIAIPPVIHRKKDEAIDLFSKGIGITFKADVLSMSDVTALGYGESALNPRGKGKDIIYVHSDTGALMALKNGKLYQKEDVFSDDRGINSYLRPWKQFDIVNNAKALIARGIGSEIVDRVKGDLRDVDLDIVFEACRNHDALAEDLVKKAALALGVRLAYLMNTLDIGTVILNKALAGSGDGFAGCLEESLKKFLIENVAKKKEIIPGVLGDEASALGAALLCRRDLFLEV